MDISYPTNEFVKMVKTWDKYDAATMGIVVLNIRRYACLVWRLKSLDIDAISRSTLPDYVFDPGERQKSALKRPNPKVSCIIGPFLCPAEDSRPFKGAGKTDKESSDLPNKRRK